MTRSKALRRARIREDMGLDQPSPRPCWYETNWFKSVELLAIVIGVGAIGYEVYQRETVDRPLAEQTFQELQASQIARLWDVINNPDRNLQSKADATVQLVRFGEPIDFLDLSCASLYGDDEARRSRYCSFSGTGVSRWFWPYPSTVDGQPIDETWIGQFNGAVREFLSHSGSSAFPFGPTGGIRDFDLSHTTPTTANEVKFTELSISRLSLANTACMSCDFEGAVIAFSDVAGSSFLGSSFDSAELYFGELADASFFSASFNDTSILSTHQVQRNFDGAWFWDDQPPRFFGLTGLQSGQAREPFDIGARVQIAENMGMQPCNYLARDLLQSGRSLPAFLDRELAGNGCLQFF